ncbi:dihydropteroate synthase [Cognataquiflexum rubidum]|uniref:dihydropteroate synthase n=1 Tax=Cognataquiflexum rubidum TaxID=2922273 RepID=UPI001F142CFB|nr:dihydropteroate synthase [Cognataquiflexum rubidum]MCH6232329.1 dihydropteroate synthase [Cognataquiflexum rubidum]
MISGIPPTSTFEDILFPTKITFCSKGKLLVLDRPWIMGILNLTPDSFFEKSRLLSSKEVFLKVSEKMVLEEVDILDIGGYSSRPMAEDISIDEELARTISTIEKIKSEFPDILISIDTFRSKVAEEAVAAGADFVNDISAGELDPLMIEKVGKLNVPYIAMHMKGTPKTMQQNSGYQNILTEIMHYFSKKLNLCLKAGIKDVMIDPGFGFSKTLEQNYWILKNLAYFKTIQAPILVGVSRKSMIHKKLGVTAEESLNGTTALHMAALINGANILRVHDVKEAKETIKLYKEIYP